MKRRNFLSGLMAAPVALKARLAQFFVRKPVESCGIAVFGLPKVPEYYQPLPNLRLPPTCLGLFWYGRSHFT